MYKQLEKHMRNINTQKGFTLFEILIGAVIFAILAATIVPLLTDAKDKNVLVTQEISLMRTTLANIEDRYFDEAIDADLDNAEVVNGRMIAASYRTVGTEIFNLFDGNVEVVGVPENGLTWTSESIPVNACAKLVDDAKNLGFETVTVDGTAVNYRVARNTDITTACDVAADTVEIIWTRANN